MRTNEVEEKQILNTNDEVSKATKVTKTFKDTIATCAGNIRKFIRKTIGKINLRTSSTEQPDQIERQLLYLQNIGVKNDTYGRRDLKLKLKEVSKKISALEDDDLHKLIELEHLRLKLGFELSCIDDRITLSYLSTLVEQDEGKRAKAFSRS